MCSTKTYYRLVDVGYSLYRGLKKSCGLIMALVLASMFVNCLYASDLFSTIKSFVVMCFWVVFLSSLKVYTVLDIFGISGKWRYALVNERWMTLQAPSGVARGGGTPRVSSFWGDTICFVFFLLRPKTHWLVGKNLFFWSPHTFGLKTNSFCSEDLFCFWS